MAISENKYYVYMHTTPNNKRYIGITRQTLEKRWRKGFSYRTQYFSRAIKKYGWDNIKHEVLFENLTEEEAKQKEIELIKKYKSNNRHYGYNITSGGNTISVYGFTKEHRENLSKAHKGNIPWNKGKKLSEETIQKIKATRKRKKVLCITNGIVYNSVKEAGDALKINVKYISAVCRNKAKTTNGYSFKYLSEVLV